MCLFGNESGKRGVVLCKSCAQVQTFQDGVLQTSESLNSQNKNVSKVIQECVVTEFIFIVVVILVGRTKLRFIDH